ncbi:MAG: tannase/feruloyl esterase family alpha/beta hydrolase, partial [Acidobacteriota bacterium]
MSLVGLAALLTSVLLVAAPSDAVPCENLATLGLQNARITAAIAIPPGAFTPPGSPAGPPDPALANLPAFCRVTASLTPTPDSDIAIEVWLPVQGWNGKLQSVGNGGWAGVIPYGALGAALASGYASAATDTGHVGNTAAFVPGHPEKLVDYGWRAVHEMTLAAKTILSAFFGREARRSYW